LTALPERIPCPFSMYTGLAPQFFDLRVSYIPNDMNTWYTVRPCTCAIVISGDLPLRVCGRFHRTRSMTRLGLARQASNSLDIGRTSSHFVEYQDTLILRSGVNFKSSNQYAQAQLSGSYAQLVRSRDMNHQKGYIHACPCPKHETSYSKYIL